MFLDNYIIHFVHFPGVFTASMAQHSTHTHHTTHTQHRHRQTKTTHHIWQMFGAHFCGYGVCFRPSHRCRRRFGSDVRRQHNVENGGRVVFLGKSFFCGGNSTHPESQGKLWRRLVSMSSGNSFVILAYSGARLIEPSCGWFPPQFHSG